MKVLFVCLGNICRSPAAEGIFLHLLKEKGVEKYFEVDSAGTSGFHIGEEADFRMQEEAKRRGVLLLSRARQFEKEDFKKFDVIFVMDKSNLRDILKWAKTEKEKSKVRLFGELAKQYSEVEIPDPYHGGREDFRHVLDMVEDAGISFLKECDTELSKGVGLSEMRNK